MPAKIYVIFIVILFGYPFLSLAQSGLVQEVEYLGDVNYDHNYLSSYVDLASGDSLSSDIIVQSINRLQRLNGVLKATTTIDSSTHGLIVRFTIEKRGTTLPIFGIGGIQDNFWATIGFSEYNLNGRNQTLETYYLNNDGRHNGKVFFQNVQIGASNWGYSFDIQRFASLEPLYFGDREIEFSYTNHAIGGNAIRRLSSNTTLYAGATFFREEYKKTSPGESENIGPDQLGQNKLLSKLLLNHNKIQYNGFYRRGSNIQAQFQNVQTLSSPTPFFSFSATIRQYWRPSERLNIALRLKTAISSNNDSPFAPFVLDSNFNIRGVGNRVDRGTAQAVFNLELRHTIYQRQRWAVQIVGFSDGGSWRPPGGDISDLISGTELRLFYGGGCRIIYSKLIDTIFRIDYGIDVFDRGQRGIVIGIGQYF